MALPKLDREIATASNEKKIAELIQPESDIRRALLHIQMITGSTPLDQTNPVDKMTINFITGQILKYYDRFTVEELVKSAELNALGEYPEKIKPYGTITWDFICDMMKAYKIRKAESMAKLARLNADKMKDEPMHVVDKENAYNSLKQLFSDNPNGNHYGNYSAAFDYAWDNKLFNVPTCDMAKWFESEKQTIITEVGRMIASSSNVVERRKLELERSDDAIKLECRKRWMIKHFTCL